MEPHRSSYPDEPEPRWYGGEQQYADPGGHARFEPHVAEGGHRMPDRRGGVRMPPPGAPGMGAPAGAWAGEPVSSMPADPSQRDMMHRDPTNTRETPRAMGRPPAPAPVSAGTHRARRPGAAAAIGIAAVASAVPVLRILLDGAAGSPPSASSVIASVLLLLGLPLGAFGLYGLATGAARISDGPAPHAWLRPPLAYLTVAMVMFVAAGLAAR